MTRQVLRQANGTPRKMMTEKELLVALLPRKTALTRLKKEGWYHIPVENAPKRGYSPCQSCRPKRKRNWIQGEL